MLLSVFKTRTAPSSFAPSCLPVLPGLGVALAVLSGCIPPDRPGGGTISGTVTDLITGDPILGAGVIFGSYSDTTDASGNYSITVDTSVSSVDGVFAVFKGLEYSFRVCGPISVDTPAEIDDGFQVSTDIHNEKCGVGTAETFGYDKSGGTGYSGSTKTYGADCFVRVDMDDPFGDPLFTFYLTGQDLFSNRSNYNHTQPSAASYTTVTLNGTIGTMFQGHLVVPGYGFVANYVDAGMFIASSQTTAEIYNPGNHPISWWTITGASDTPGPGDMTMRINAQQIAFSDTITLPGPFTDTGPTATVDGATASWDGSTLSFDPVPGATAYVVYSTDDSGFEAVIWMGSSSITFPVEFVTSVLDPGAGWDIVIYPLWGLEFSIYSQPQEGVTYRDFKCVMVTPADLTKADVIP